MHAAIQSRTQCCLSLQIAPAQVKLFFGFRGAERIDMTLEFLKVRHYFEGLCVAQEGEFGPHQGAVQGLTMLGVSILVELRGASSAGD